MNDNLLTNEQGRLNYLDVYKGVSIIFIIVVHYDWTTDQYYKLLFPFWIEMAVPIFMVITGYVSAMSFNKRNLTIRDSYKPKEIIAKWMRFVIPFLPIFIIEIVAMIIERHEFFTVIQLIKLFVVGGQGPGSYYLPIMIQIVLITPIIWSLIERFPVGGGVTCFVANVLYEIVKTITNMNSKIYRLCALRYIFILAYGIFLFVERKGTKRKNLYYIIGLLGAAYIIIFNYTPAEPIITDQWTVTSVFAVLFIVPIMMHLIKENNMQNKFLELLGRASFNIFLIQMLYYPLASKIVYQIIGDIVDRVVINILICCVVGVTFYKIENPITQKFIKIIRG